MSKLITDAPTAPAERADETAGRTVPDLLLSILGGAMVLGALVVLIFGGPRDTGVPPFAAVSAPPLSIVTPTDGDVVASALSVEFEGPAQLRRMPGGWGVDSLHIHAAINGREFMPAPNDITPLGGARFAWSMQRLPSGPVTVRLYWSDAAHRPIEAGASTPVTVTVH